MKYKIFTILIITILIATNCDQNPVKSSSNNKVKIQFLIKKTDEQENKLNSPLSQSLGKASKIQEFTKARGVFYNIHTDYEQINQNYLDNESQINSFLNNFEGDQQDFDNYWIERDKGELKLETAGNYSIETKGSLKISEGRASGEFELSYGLKSCRIGLFENGILTYVGRPSSYYGKYFEIYEPEAHHEEHHHEEHATWVYVTFSRVY